MRPSFLAWAFLLPFISSASAALLTVTANPVVGLERPLSNGERFQRGLLPAAPKRRAFRAREAMPSPDPATRGRIRIINSDGSFLGYLAPTTGYTTGYVGVKGTAATSFVFATPTFTAGTTKADISIQTTTDSRFAGRFLGVIGGDLISSSSLAASVAGVSQTAAGAVSQGGPNSENTLVASESSIWSIGEGGELNAVWINKDSTAAPLSFCYSPTLDRIYALGKGGTGCDVLVTFKLVL